MKKNIDCNVLAVDCVNNDPVDIKAGGPEKLGFDFYVLPEETEYLKNFITKSLEELCVPLQRIYISGTTSVTEDKVWNQDKIFESLVKEAESLKHEASRNYPSISKK